MYGRLSTLPKICILGGWVAAAGCTTGQVGVSQLQQQLAAKNSQIASLESAVQERDTQLMQQSQAVERAQLAVQEAMDQPQATPVSANGGDLFPPNAKPGECYARVFVPPSYATTRETVLKRQASERIEIIPAQYEWVEETILVKEASEELVSVPPKYEWVEERVLVKSASQQIEQVPPVYETVTERVLDRPAHTVWKKGRGPIERIDHATGEIMCLVEIPATYKTIEKRVLKTPASTRVVEIPAEYKTVRKRVLVEPATVRKVEIFAEYDRVKVRKLVSPPQERRIPIEAQYQTVSRQNKVSDGHMAWRPILCETNVTREVVMALQNALLEAGFNPGNIDGRLGGQTLTAVESYQRASGLARGGLTMETLRSLEVQPGLSEI